MIAVITHQKIFFSKIIYLRECVFVRRKGSEGEGQSKRKEQTPH